MNHNNRYNTMLEAIEDLQKRGYKHNFKINEMGRLAEGLDQGISAYEVELHEFHRFEGQSNPSDSSIVYAVETSLGQKGIVVDSFGVDGSETTSEFMNKVAQKKYEL